MLTLHENEDSTPRSETGKKRSETIDLEDDRSLLVDISDALSEKEKVRFTIHVKTALPGYPKNDCSVVRQHEEFLWLHDVISNNADYSGYIIPPQPPRPDFESSRDKLQKLGDDASMSQEEFNKTKEELEAEYLATFKKTVAMHEVFLKRLAGHPKFKFDENFKIFLTYKEDLSVRGKNTREKLTDFLVKYGRTADDLVLNSTHKEIDEYFERQKEFLVTYYRLVKDAASKSDKMTQSHRRIALSYKYIAGHFASLAPYKKELAPFLQRVGEYFEKARKFEERTGSDEDLKLSDTLKYYIRETSAAKDLLHKRVRSLASSDAANKNLDKARLKNKDIQICEAQQQQAHTKFVSMSKLAKEELKDFDKRRVAAFGRNFIDLAELELKHARGQRDLLKECLSFLKTCC